MEEAIKLLVDSIHSFFQDPSGVFSVRHLCECRIGQWRHDSCPFLLLNELGFLCHVCSLEKKKGEQVCLLYGQKLENENSKKKTLYDLKVFKEYVHAWREKRNGGYYARGTARNHQKFVLAVRNKNGARSSQSVYPKHRSVPSQNQLWMLLNDKEFYQVQDILKQKQKQLIVKCPSLSDYSYKKVL